MEPFLADLIKNPKVPKIIRCLMVIAVVGFVMFIGIMCGLRSVTLFGRIFGYALAAVMLAAGAYIVINIIRKGTI